MRVDDITMHGSYESAKRRLVPKATEDGEPLKTESPASYCGIKFIQKSNSTMPMHSTIVVLDF